MIRRRNLIALAASAFCAPDVFAQTARSAPAFSWKTASLSPQEFDADLLERLPALLRTDFPGTMAVTIVRKDQILLDYRREGSGKDELFRLYSVTKSVLAILIGIALDRGILPSLDGTVVSYFPEIDFSGADPRTRGITIRQIMTMTAGLSTASLPGIQPPQVTTTGLFRAIADQPGTVFSYDNNATNILGIVLSRIVGKRLDVFAEEVLLRPLGITEYRWRQTPDGHPAASGGLSLSMDSLIRLGRLVSRKGDWDGQRIISEEFITRMLKPQQLVNTREELHYGFFWFIQKTPDGKHDSYIAQGYGGQVLVAVPALQLIVATTTQPETGVNTRFIRSMILPAARG
ncbi:MAG: serine hydrolase domain-containing protein [Beijerinckiaceae bacterium]